MRICHTRQNDVMFTLGWRSERKLGRKLFLESDMADGGHYMGDQFYRRSGEFCGRKRTF